MTITLSLDSEVLSALVDLMGVIKPYHDKYFTYAVVADNFELSKFVKYIRRRSHEKGSLWKDLLFYINDFGSVQSLPSTPEFTVNLSQSIADVLGNMLSDETACRMATEKVVALARSKNENRIIHMLKKYVDDFSHNETHLEKFANWLETVNGDLYEWQSRL